MVKITQGRMEREDPVIGLLGGEGQKQGIDQSKTKQAG